MFECICTFMACTYVLVLSIVSVALLNLITGPTIEFVANIAHINTYLNLKLHLELFHFIIILVAL